MKHCSTRQIDDLGRIVIPSEIRTLFDIEHKTPIEIFVDGQNIVLRKYSPHTTCHVTGQISPRNKAYANGNIVLSTEGAKKLKREIEIQLEKSKKSLLNLSE